MEQVRVEVKDAPEPNLFQKKSIFLPALTSYILLPGFDQFWEGQLARGFAFLGGSQFGYLMANDGYRSNAVEPLNSESGSILSLNYQTLLGIKLADFSGSLSAYDSFSMALESRPEDFPFIKKRESIEELMTAPFDFSLFERPTTYIPLAIEGTLFGLMSLNLLEGASDPFVDIAASGGVSYMAGVGEEALFRGWLLPVTHYYSDSAVFANASTSALFGMVHYNSKTNRFPIVQTALGAYFAYLTQKNDYSLRESIFLHTWWDIFALSAAFLDRSNHASDVGFYKTIFQYHF